MGAINLIVEKTLPVLCKIQVSQPISNIIFAPVGEGLRHKRLIGWRRSEGRVAYARWGGASRQEVGRRERAGDQYGVRRSHR